MAKKHSTDNKVNNVNKVKKDIMLRVRVTAEEREKFTVMAKEKGFKSVSEYIRSLVADEEEIPKKRRSKKKTLDNIA